LAHLAGSILGSAYPHELGHCVPAWVHGYPAIPTPAKEYILAAVTRDAWIAPADCAANDEQYDFRSHFLDTNSAIQDKDLLGDDEPIPSDGATNRHSGTQIGMDVGEAGSTE
jgi:hypothetical protein